MSLNEKGKLKSHEIAETVIRVDRRMTYTAVQQILEGDKEQQEAYQEFVPMFFCMEELSKLLRARREKRGSIDFDFPESKVLLDEAGHPVAVKPYEHNTATKIIEDFMLLANETVASEYHDRELPFVYRIHEEPDADRMEGVLAFLRANQIPVQKAKAYRQSQRSSENTAEYRWNAAGTHGQQTAAALDEAGVLFRGGRRTFWFGGGTLLPFYIADQALSGSADSSNHQRCDPGQNGAGADASL